MISIDLALYVVLGAAVGALHFVLLLQIVRLHTAQVSGFRIVPLHLIRLAVTIVVFWGLAQEGPMPLLLALLGFLIARLSVQRRVGAD